jgi:hypothetical protein
MFQPWRPKYWKEVTERQMTDIISKDQYTKWAQEIASKIDVGEIIKQGDAAMTTKKDKINLAQPASVLPENKIRSAWEGKTGEELAKEQGIKPIKDENDFARISGGQEDWEDIDQFLKYFHSH